MADENKIDLYADSEDLNLLSVKLDQCDDDVKPDPETDALYDSVVTNRINGDGEEDRVNQKHGDVNIRAGDECLVTEGLGSSEIATKIHKFSVLVGNLTWFTTDLDIETCLKEIGVEDVIDIKFVDNRTNGQSKGYCSVHVGSDKSVRLIHEKLPKKELNEKRVMVAAPSKVATAQFEAQSDCKSRAQQQQPNAGAIGNNNSRNSMLPPLQLSVPPQPFGLPPPPGVPRLIGPPPRVNRNMIGSEVNSPPSARMLNMGHPHQRPPPMPPHHMNFGPHPPRPHGLPFHPHNSRSPYRPYHQPGHPPCSFPHPLSPNSCMDHRVSHPPRGEWMHNGPHGPPPMPPHCPPGPMGHLLPPDIESPSCISLNESSPAPHVNPAFFQPQYSPPMTITSPEVPQTKIPRSRDNPQKLSTYVSPSRSSEKVTPPHPQINRYPVLSEPDVGEIVSRNRTVSSSAISRAVTDAAKGDFASAIETLVTAISLIKQSRVGSDERCKILITSLQDTLHGIETKSYSRVRVVHMRSKSRSRSRERNCVRYRSHHHHYRSRSRSRGRSRSREHYHRERGRSRSVSSSKGQDFERNSKYDDRDRYRDHDRDRHNREREHDRDRDNNGSKSNNRGSSGGTSRIHEENERIEHKSSRR